MLPGLDWRLCIKLALLQKSLSIWICRYFIVCYKHNELASSFTSVVLLGCTIILLYWRFIEEPP